MNFTVAGVNKKNGMPYLLTTFSNSNYSELYRIVYNPTSDEEDEKLDKQKKKELLQLYQDGVISYDKIFEEFKDGLYFPSEATGKQTLTYIDEPLVDQFEDYQGNVAPIYECSCIHMEPQSYFMSQTYEYLQFLKGYKDASI